MSPISIFIVSVVPVRNCLCIEKIIHLFLEKITQDYHSFILLRKLNSHSNTGRFGTKGLAISFSSEDSEEDQKVLKDVQERFDVSIPSLSLIHI